MLQHFCRTLQQTEPDVYTLCGIANM